MMISRGFHVIVGLWCVILVIGKCLMWWRLVLSVELSINSMEYIMVALAFFFFMVVQTWYHFYDEV